MIVINTENAFSEIWEDIIICRAVLSSKYYYQNVINKHTHQRDYIHIYNIILQWYSRTERTVGFCLSIEHNICLFCPSSVVFANVPKPISLVYTLCEWVCMRTAERPLSRYFRLYIIIFVTHYIWVIQWRHQNYILYRNKHYAYNIIVMYIMLKLFIVDRLSGMTNSAWAEGEVLRTGRIVYYKSTPPRVWRIYADIEIKN